VTAAARLVWERSDGGKVEFPLDGDDHELGRDEDVAIRVDEPLVSRRHARIQRRGEGWVVVDLGSTNGTEVNGRKVERRAALDDGDRITVGSTELVFGRSRP